MRREEGEEVNCRGRRNTDGTVLTLELENTHFLH